MLYSYGFMLCSSKNSNCNLFWTNTHVGAHVLRSMKSWQRINHFPRSYLITKKDTLYESIDRASVQYGDLFDFIPDPFIVKPAGSSRGIGIRFINSEQQVDELNNNEKLLISRYIDRPFLVKSLKWDLRVYVLVTSFYPLIIYIYSDGLARFAVHEYEENRGNYADVNTHLTNYSLNKSSKKFVKNVGIDSENVGHKWTLGALLREMEKQGVDTPLLMVRIEDIVIKTLLSIQGSVAASCRKLNLHPKCCFELFGFDILVDENLKPWLLEVNLSPSLACDAPIDSILKTNLLADTLNIAEIPLVRQKNILNSDPAAVLSEAPGVAKTDEQALRRKRMSNRVSKVRRAQLNHKPSFSAENINAQYLARAKCHFDKLQSEIEKKGHFIRVFPRKSTWSMYSSILEDVGQEKWDEDLYFRMTEGVERPNITVRDIKLAHQQLLNTTKFPSRKELSSVVREVLLQDALTEANRYKMKMYSADLKPYPAALPRVRSPARRRTKSQLFAEELRKLNLAAQKLVYSPKTQIC
uniref:Tubulin--tyrosine ligase-like protein 5 n=1 Tax=Ditylenchus dipsaci TaxID=166011 RepID=A0A915DH08_9BILA